MFRMKIDLGNRNEYRFYNSLWAANIIAIQLVRAGAECVEIFNLKENKIEQTYKKG